jgi:hypothetical protein
MYRSEREIGTPSGEEWLTPCRKTEIATINHKCNKSLEDYFWSLTSQRLLCYGKENRDEGEVVVEMELNARLSFLGETVINLEFRGNSKVNCLFFRRLRSY